VKTTLNVVILWLISLLRLLWSLNQIRYPISNFLMEL
jgi:hypothetical protein